MEIRKGHYDTAVITMQEYNNAWKEARALRIEHKDLTPKDGIDTIKIRLGARLLRDWWEPKKQKIAPMLALDLARCMYERGFGIEQNLRQYVKGYAELKDNFVAFWGEEATNESM